MISVQLMGGLGNQLFQMATCIGYAKKHDIDYCIPLHTLNDEIWKPYHFKKVNYCNTNIVVTAQEYKEQKHLFLEIPFYDVRHIVLRGYFQSFLYFQDFREKILELFGFDNLQTKHNWCSIHVRRNDYLKYPTKHPVVTQKYLILAIEEIFNKTGIENYLVFSDDLDWCKSFFKNISAFDSDWKGQYKLRFYFSENNDEITDLKLMAECEHNIIANSTFSWWGGWLNNNPDKIVVTPHEDNWFGVDNKHLDVSTLLPESWIRIKY